MPWGFRNKLLETAPRWLRGILGTQKWAILCAFGEQLDHVAFFARWAFRCYFLEKCPDSLLDFWGKERLLSRFSSETLTQYRARLVAAPMFYRTLGTNASIVSTFALLGFTARVVCTKDWPVSTWDNPTRTWNNPTGFWDAAEAPDADDEFWNRIWVEVELDAPFGKWDAAPEIWDAAPEIWDRVGLTAAQLRYMKALVKRCRSCYNLFVAFVFISPDGSRAFLSMGEEGE